MEAVRQMSFSCILDLNIRELHCHLAYEVLQQFNPRNSELEMPNRTRVQITEDDVTRVFGFPRRKNEIEIFGRT